MWCWRGAASCRCIGNRVLTYWPCTCVQLAVLVRCCFAHLLFTAALVLHGWCRAIHVARATAGNLGRPGWFRVGWVVWAIHQTDTRAHFGIDAVCSGACMRTIGHSGQLRDLALDACRACLGRIGTPPAGKTNAPETERHRHRFGQMISNSGGHPIPPWRPGAKANGGGVCLSVSLWLCVSASSCLCVSASLCLCCSSVLGAAGCGG